MTNRLFVPFALKLVIECQFRTGFDKFVREETDSRGAIHRPFLSVAVRIARVVDEPSLVSFRSGVDDRVGVNCQHVEIRLVQFVVMVQSPSMFLVVN